MIHWSQAGHNEAYRNDGFVGIKTSLEEMPEIIMQGNAYSPYLFNHFTRSIENNLGGHNSLMIDLDNVEDMAETQQRWKEFKCFTITTRSHRKVKNGELQKDCFRMVFETISPVFVSDKVAVKRANQIFAATIHKNHDPSAVDLARWFFSSPPDSEVWISGGKRLVDFNKLLEVAKAEIAAKKSRVIKPWNGTRQGKQSNTLQKDTVFETQYGLVSFECLRDSMFDGDLVQCKCLQGIDHGGQGKHHRSAFIAKSGGNVFYRCSGGRCANNQTLWCED